MDTLLQVSKLASDYAQMCVVPDGGSGGLWQAAVATPTPPPTSQTTPAAAAGAVADTCDVYVWGSNSSHQLAEGNQEKVTQPKLAGCFSSAQQVIMIIIIIIIIVAQMARN